MVLDQWEMGGSPLTIEFYAKWSSYGNWSRIIDFGNSAGDDNIIIANFSTTAQLVLSVRNGSSEKRVYTDSIITLNTFYHVVICIGNTSDDFKLYIDGIKYPDDELIWPSGQSRNIITSDIPATTRSTHYVGESHWSSDPYFNGTISYIRFWNQYLEKHQTFKH